VFDSGIVHWGVMSKAVLVENNLRFIEKTLNNNVDLYKHREKVQSMMNSTRTVSESSIVNINAYDTKDSSNIESILNKLNKR
jgi:hypothetical protein